MNNITYNQAETFFLENYQYLIDQIAISIHVPFRRFTNIHDEEYKQEMMIAVWNHILKYYNPQKSGIKTFITLAVKSLSIRISPKYTKLDKIEQLQEEYQQ